MMLTRYPATAMIAVATVLSLSPSALLAQDVAPLPDEARQLRRQVEDLEQREAEYRRRLAELEARLAMIEQAAAVPLVTIPADEAADLRGAYIAPMPLAIPDDPSLAFFRERP